MPTPDPAGYDAINEYVAEFSPGTMPPELRARAEAVYGKELVARYPRGFDLLEADDRKSFANPSAPA